MAHQCNRYSAPPWLSQFPNYFGHTNDKEASVSFQRFDEIFQMAPKKCSSLLASFLCGLYAPSCRGTERLLKPCRELCLEAKSQCKRVIRDVSKTKGFQWPSDLKCRNFPREDEEPCYNGQSAGGDSTTPQTGDKRPYFLWWTNNIAYQTYYASSTNGDR